MELSIIIVNYNTKDFLLPCIKGIEGNTKNLDYEIIVVDNASKDNSAEYIKQNLIPRFGNLRLIEAGSNLGFSAGNNLGVKQSDGKYILIINSDIELISNLSVF